MELELTPPSTGTMVVLGLVAAALVATALMFVWVTWLASRGSITITDDEIKVHVPIYGRTIPISSLDLANARVLNLDEISGALRTN